MESEEQERLRHNFLERRPSDYGRATIPIGEKVRAGLGYPPTVKLMPNLGRPWVELGNAATRTLAGR